MVNSNKVNLTGFAVEQRRIMHNSLIGHTGMVSENPGSADLVGHFSPAVFFQNRDKKGIGLFSGFVQRLFQLFFVQPGGIKLGGIQHFIGINNQKPVTGCIVDGLISVLAEIIFPGVMVYCCVKRFCNFNGSVGRSRINYDNFVHKMFDAVQASFKHFFFIFDDHAGR